MNRERKEEKKVLCREREKSGDVKSGKKKNNSRRKEKVRDDKNRILYDTIKWTSGWLAKKNASWTLLDIALHNIKIEERLWPIK